MTLGYSTALRTARAQATKDFAGSYAFLRFYDGTKPSTTGGAVTTQNMLAEFPLDVSFGNAVSGNLVANGAYCGAATNSGSPTWFRVVKADGTTHVMDGTAGTAGTDFLFSLGNTFVAGEPNLVLSWQITESNA